MLLLLELRIAGFFCGFYLFILRWVGGQVIYSDFFPGGGWLKIYFRGCASLYSLV
jgi:hypothetical protein